MPKLKTYNLFISHSWRYSENYERLVSLLDEAPDFEWKDFSVPRENPIPDIRTVKDFEDELRDQIRPVHCVLILAGVYSSYSDSIQREIDIAEELQKPIVAIRLWGSERASGSAQRAAAEIVNWNSSSIVSAIRDNAI